MRLSHTGVPDLASLIAITMVAISCSSTPAPSATDFSNSTAKDAELEWPATCQTECKALADLCTKAIATIEANDPGSRWSKDKTAHELCMFEGPSPSFFECVEGAKDTQALYACESDRSTSDQTCTDCMTKRQARLQQRLAPQLPRELLELLLTAVEKSDRQALSVLAHKQARPHDPMFAWLLGDPEAKRVLAYLIERNAKDFKPNPMLAKGTREIGFKEVLSLEPDWTQFAIGRTTDRWFLLLISPRKLTLETLTEDATAGRPAMSPTARLATRER